MAALPGPPFWTSVEFTAGLSWSKVIFQVCSISFTTSTAKQMHFCLRILFLMSSEDLPWCWGGSKTQLTVFFMTCHHCLALNTIIVCLWNSHWNICTFSLLCMVFLTNPVSFINIMPEQFNIESGRCWINITGYLRNAIIILWQF